MSWELRFIFFSIPKIADGNFSFCIPYQDLVPYVKKLYDYALEVNNKIKFLEIPFCVFDKLDTENINNKIAPPDLGKNNQPPEQHKTEVKDLPKYRIKEKPEMCKNCKASKHCDGFLANMIDEFGTGDLEPIK